MDVPAELDLAREAHRRQEWAGAYARFTAVDQVAPLDAGDVELLAESAELVDHGDEAVRLLLRAYQAHLDGGNIAGAVRCGWWLYHAFRLRGEPTPARGWLVRTGRLIETMPSESPVKGFLLVPEAELRYGEGDYAAAHAAAGQAVEIGNRCGDHDVVALAAHVQGRALIKAGRVAEGLLLLDEAMVAAAAGELSTRIAGWVYCSVVDACHELFELRRAREWTAALAEWCEAQPSLTGAFAGLCRVHRSEILQLSGAWPGAVREAQLACNHLAVGLGRGVAGAGLYQLAEMHRLRGEFPDAELSYRAANLHGWEPQPGWALLRLAQGKVDAAAAAIRRALAETTDRLARARLLAAAVEIMLTVGDIPAARDAATELSQFVDHYEMPALHAMAAHAEGAVELAEGKAGSALPVLRRSWRLWWDLEVPYEAARVRVLVGLACGAVGDEDTAAMEFDAAHVVFEQLGAVPDLRRVDSLIRKIGADESSGLTAREVEVLRLVATGKTNQDIATELHLSKKTVARHVSNICAKLGVSSRTAAAAYGYEHRIL